MHKQSFFDTSGNYFIKMPYLICLWFMYDC